MKSSSSKKALLTSMTRAFEQLRSFKSRTYIKQLLVLVIGVSAVGFGVLQANSQTMHSLGAHATEQQTATYTAVQVVNEDGNQFSIAGRTNSGPTWIGTGSTTLNSYLGIVFEGPTLPSDAVIEDIRLAVTPTQTQYISQAIQISAYADDAVRNFTRRYRPSQLPASAATVSNADDVQWIAGTAYQLPSLVPLSSIISTHQGKIAVVIQGTGSRWGRKFIFGTESPQQAPQLTITYTLPPPPTPTPPSDGTDGHSHVPGESMAMHGWKVGGKNSPLPEDLCEDGTDVVAAHNMYHVIGYDGLKYPTWHPPVVDNPITGNGKCYFGHEHGSNPQEYLYWNDIATHFGKDLNGDGTITPIQITSDGVITPGDRAGLPFGIANEHMEKYYNQEMRDSIFVRHEDHVGHKVEFVNNESDMIGNTTHTMAQLAGTVGINIPYGDSNNYRPTGVVCTHLHKFHQGTHSGDAIQNNMHETIMHSKCVSVNIDGINAAALYPDNEVLLTSMMTFGDPGGYKRFCGNDRTQLQCPLGKTTQIIAGEAREVCVVDDPLLSKLPDAIYSESLGRNMVDRSCLEDVESITGSQYFTPYEIWEGDLRIVRADGKLLAEHGRQWDVLDPIRFVDPASPTGYSYNSEQCGEGGLLHRRTLLCEVATGEYGNTAWNSPKSGFRGLKRTTYFGRNRVSNQGGPEIWWTDPLGGNATTTEFTSGLKQKFSSVEADICKLSVCSTMNDRAIQRQFPDGNGTVHAPN
jgi:hypothetical protein